MNNESGKIKNFTDLDTWKEGHKLVISIYRAIKNFPKEERFGISSQMSRAVVSITSNIAEGFSRMTIKEKKQFYSVAKASLTELQNQLIICKDIDYVNSDCFREIINQSVIVHKLINGLIRGLSNFH